MDILRKVGDVQLNKGEQMAKGLFNLSNEETGELSYWFDELTAKEFLKMSDEEFLTKAQYEIHIAELKIE